MESGKTKFQALFKEALLAHQQGRVDVAEVGYRKLLTFYPDHPPSLVNLGVILKTKGMFDAAIALYQRALALDSAAPSTLGNLGNAYLQRGDVEKALECHEKALKASPESAEAFFNKGLSLRALGRLQDAIFCFDRALALNPDHAEAQWDRSLSLLMNNELNEGFASYEARWKLPEVVRPSFSQPAWSGTNPSGQRLLVYAEQGFGDTLHFVRYCQWLQEQGAEVILQVQPELLDILDTCPYIDAVYPFGADVPVFDAHIALLSIPFLAGISPENIYAPIPYIDVPAPEQALDYLKRPKTTLKVGLVWAGRPTHKNDRHRSAGLLPLLPLLQVPHTAFFSLQMGERVQDLAEHGVNGLIYDCSRHINTFIDTAHILQQLDVVITIDSAVAHLAGAMGKEVWVLLPFIGDWRWQQQGEATPWYPTMRLFRQPKVGDWATVIKNVANALAAKVSSFSISHP